MNYELPQLLPHCTVPKQQFCKTCRDKEKGRVFRKGVLARQKIQGVQVDFSCPKNKPWNSNKEQNMKVKSISKDQVKDNKTLFDEVNKYKLGQTSDAFLLPGDKFTLLKNEYGITEQKSKTKVVQKSAKKKKGCSSCGRKR